MRAALGRRPCIINVSQAATRTASMVMASVVMASVVMASMFVLCCGGARWGEKTSSVSRLEAY